MRFMEVISWFMDVIFRFMEVMYKFLNISLNAVQKYYHSMSIYIVGLLCKAICRVCAEILIF